MLCCYSGYQLQADAQTRSEDRFEEQMIQLHQIAQVQVQKQRVTLEKEQVVAKAQADADTKARAQEEINAQQREHAAAKAAATAARLQAEAVAAAAKEQKLLSEGVAAVGRAGPTHICMLASELEPLSDQLTQKLVKGRVGKLSRYEGGECYVFFTVHSLVQTIHSFILTLPEFLPRLSFVQFGLVGYRGR